jgi:hypothetical protein
MTTEPMTPDSPKYSAEVGVDVQRLVRQASFERGCENKMRLSLNESPHLKAQELAKKHGKDFGVYRCRFCDLYHLTSKLEKQEQYAPLVYQTEFFKTNDQVLPARQPKSDHE